MQEGERHSWQPLPLPTIFDWTHLLQELLHLATFHSCFAWKLAKDLIQCKSNAEESFVAVSTFMAWLATRGPCVLGMYCCVDDQLILNQSTIVWCMSRWKSPWLWNLIDIAQGVVVWKGVIVYFWYFLILRTIRIWWNKRFLFWDIKVFNLSCSLNWCCWIVKRSLSHWQLPKTTRDLASCRAP